MKDKLIIVTLACVSLLALALTVRVGIGLYDHEHPASTVHAVPLPALADIAHHDCTDPSLPSWAKRACP
jgi:hypothetical protein